MNPPFDDARAAPQVRSGLLAFDALMDSRDRSEFEVQLVTRFAAEFSPRQIHAARVVSGETTSWQSWRPVPSQNDGDGVRLVSGSLNDGGVLAIVGIQAAGSNAPVIGEHGMPSLSSGHFAAVALGEPAALVIAGEWSDAQDSGGLEARLAAFAAGAGRAWSEFRRRHEAGRRSLQAKALEEMARVAVSPRHLVEVKQIALRLAVQGTGADGGVVWSFAESGAPHAEITHGAAGVREAAGEGLGAVAATAMATLRPQVVDDPLDDVRMMAGRAPWIAGAAVWPLASYERVRGALGVFVESRTAAGFDFESFDREFLSALTDLVALAADHADRFTELRDAERRAREVRGELERGERLTELGRLAAQAANEATAPVASIRAFTRRALQATGDPGLRECLEIVLREAGRLERLLDEQRGHAEAGPPSLELASLNVAIDDGLAEMGETLVRRRVRLVKRLSPDVPSLLLDPRRIRHAVSNLLRFALDSVGIGGRVRIETRRAGNHVVLELAHDGSRSPGEIMEQLFVPFAAARPGGPALGLGVAQRIVHEHGGEIRVRADGEWSTVFSFTLPVGGNQDRRRVPSGRRRREGDRRTAGAA